MTRGRSLALKQPADWTVAQAYGQIASWLEDGQDQSGEVVPVHHFIEDPGWVDLPLRPRQRLLLKVVDAAIHKQPLDTHLEAIALTGRYRVDTDEDPGVSQRLAGQLPHAVAWDNAQGCYVYDERADWAYLLQGENRYARVLANCDPASREPLTLVFIMGRGSSKTTYLSAGISAWVTYHILSQANPHGYFGLAPVKPLRIQNVATSATQAGEFFDSYRTLIEKCPWFDGKYQTPIAGGMAKFIPHLYAEKTSSNSRSSRGRDTVAYVHDELAFSDKTSGPRSDKRLYEAIRKAVKTRGGPKGLVVVVSSPAEADGVLYELYAKAEAGALENSLVVQMATWEAIPGQSKADYAAEYRQDEDVADMEYGASFYSGASNLLPAVATRFGDMATRYARLLGTERPAHWHALPDADEETLYLRRQRRYPRVIHVDTSERIDRLVLVMAHVRERCVVIDLVRAWDREVSYTRELLPFIKQLADRFAIDQVTFDQAHSVQLIQDLNDMGITAAKTAYTQAYNDAIARNFKTCVTEGLLATYAVPRDMVASYDTLINREGWDQDPAVWPWLSLALLQREMQAAKKVVRGGHIAAEAPTAGPTQTDDALDAAMAAVYQAITLAGGLGSFLTVPANPAAIEASRRGPNGEVVPGDTLPTEPGGVKMRDVFCPHHKGWVRMHDDERLAPCPECRRVIQVRL